MHVNEYVASKIVALRDFQKWVLEHGDEYPVDADNWSFMFDLWIRRPEIQNPTNSYAPHMRHMAYKLELEKLEGK